MIKNLNRLITINNIKFIIKTLLTNKNPGPDRFKGEFYQTLKQTLKEYLFSSNYSKKKKERENRKLANSFSTATMNLILKPKTLQKKSNP